MLQESRSSRVMVFIYGTMVTLGIGALVLLYAPRNRVAVQPVGEEADVLNAEMQPLLRTPAENYEVYCAQCHGVAGEGDGPMVSMMTVKPPRLSQVLPLYKENIEEVVSVIRNGKGVMPGFYRELDEPEAIKIAEYLFEFIGQP